MRRDYTFYDFPQVEEITLTINYTIGPDCRVTMADGEEQRIMEQYIRQGQQAIRSVPDKLMDLEFVNAPAKWAKENNE
jgi:hypothetical protein